MTEFVTTQQIWPQPKDDDVRVVIPDVHGHHEALKILLESVGAVHKGTKQPGYFVAQIGDLMNMCSDTREHDAETVKKGNEWIDMQILGNHEACNVFGMDNHAFGGMDYPHMLDPDTLLYAKKRKWQIAGVIDGYLLTHAGVHPHYQIDVDSYDGECEEERFAAYLQDIFVNRLINRRGVPVIDSVGVYGAGYISPGGVLWLRPQELTDQDWHDNRLRQVVGHTAVNEQFDMSVAGGFSGASWWLSDVGAGKSDRIGCLTKLREDETWTPLLMKVPLREPENPERVGLEVVDIEGSSE